MFLWGGKADSISITDHDERFPLNIKVEKNLF